MLKAFIGIVCLCLVVLAGIQIFRHVSNPSAGESADLRKLKELLQHPYRTETKITQAGNITSINTVDVHEEEIINLIVKSRQRDITPWLQQHAAQYCPKYLYFLAYRMAIQKAPIQDTLFWVFLAQMRAAADAALCKDPAVGQYLVLLNMEIVYPTLHAYAKAETLMNDPEQLKQIMKKVVAWDEQHPQTNSPDWICKSGHAVSTSEAYPQNEWEQRRRDFKREYTASLYK